jgi:hypothetical protein
MSDERKEPSVRLRACQDAVAASELLVLSSKHVYCSLMSLGMGDTIERVHRDALLLPGEERGASLVLEYGLYCKPRSVVHSESDQATLTRR